MTVRGRSALAATAGLILLLAPLPVRAAMKLAEFRGHLSVGYTKLFSDSLAPAGSMSVAAGLDYPLSRTLRAGPEFGYHLLGRTQVGRGSLGAELNYGVFEALALLHWSPPWRGPLGRVSIGPGVFNARADLTSSGSAAFSDLARDQTVAGGALGFTLIQRGEAPVRVGFEASMRIAPLHQETWTLLSGRLAFHY